VRRFSLTTPPPLRQAEVSFSVGPVPVDDGVGKEVATRWSSSVANGEQPAISTDSNGREFLPRVYNYRPTWNLSNAEPVCVRRLHSFGAETIYLSGFRVALSLSF
jgi:hypothetical protein